MQVTLYPHPFKMRQFTTLVIGAFESVHNGHLSLIDEAKKRGKPLAVMLIKNPEALPKHGGELYAMLSTRLQQLANLGVDYVIVVEFNDDLSLKPGAVFLQELMRIAKVESIVVGDDFAMGANRDWVAKVVALSNPGVHLAPMIRFNQAKLSTTTLRELVQVGDVEIITKLAPFPYTVETKVQGDNDFVISTVAPQKGVYAVAAVVNEVRYWGVVRIGMARHELVVPQLLAKPPYEVTLEFYKLLRVIVAERQDQLTLEDEKDALLFLTKRW